MSLLKGAIEMQRHLFLAVTLGLLATCRAGPVGPLPNVTSSDLGLKDGSCAVGDVVYLVGDEFPGSTPCERCSCASSGVRCTRQRCEPRAGCKAVHRPDQCCPIYQCECEQEGRVYGNGEKLVDPADPCRVCYCQGGEVVCRRIACFVRDDCLPRLVPGRCCPEYDNCPLRGVSAIPGVAPTMSSISTEIVSSSVPQAPKENIRQEITIKEITPVSEIPAITEVKIKEILPSPAIEIPEYTSSKSPLIVREATSEKPASNDEIVFSKTDAPVAIEVQPSPSSPPTLNESIPSEILDSKVSDSNLEVKKVDTAPSKISLSTQDTINSEIPSLSMSIPTLGVPSVPEIVAITGTTKAPVVEEEDPALFDHNPAFPPIPDDLSVIGNHEDEALQEQNVDGVPNVDQETPNVLSVVTSAQTVIVEQPFPTTIKNLQDPTNIVEESDKESSVDLNTVSEFSSTSIDTSTTATERTSFKNSPMLNLRSAIPTEILNLPSSVPEEITGELDSAEESTSPRLSTQYPTTENIAKLDKTTEKSEFSTTFKDYSSPTVIVTEEPTTDKPTQTTVVDIVSSREKAESSLIWSSSTVDNDLDTTAQTELRLASQLPNDTASLSTDYVTETIFKETVTSATAEPIVELSPTKISSATELEVITVSRAIPSNTENQSFENVETTEFIVTSLGSSESATDAVELIKISAEPEKSASLIEPQRAKNMLTDFINLVGDVAAIGDHTEGPEVKSRTTASGISESEELILINAGYKSKNSNWNVNSITELPIKSKNQVALTKQKVIEIEGDDSDTLTDSAPPHDKIEPTTRRPIIDNVSDNPKGNKTEKKDIEIINKSYVPTINRRPTKVVMKKNNEKPFSAETTVDAITSVFSEDGTESTINVSNESVSTAEPDAQTAAPDLTQSIPLSTTTANAQ